MPLRALISPDEWERVLVAAMKYAGAVLRRFHGTTPDGLTAVDFAIAAASALDKRATEDSEFASLVKHSIGVQGAAALRALVIGELRRIIPSHRARLRRRNKIEQEQSWKADWATAAHEAPRRYPPLPRFSDDDLLPDVAVEHAENRLKILTALPRRRPLARRIVQSIIDSGYSDPAELAAQLGTDRDAIYAELKWLRRNLRAILATAGV